MTKTFTAQAAPIALAAVLTMAMLFATNALAGHQYRVAVATQRTAAPTLALATQAVGGTGHRAA